MPDVKRGPSKRKRWAILLLIVTVLFGVIFSGRSVVDRAKMVQKGMTRAEVQQIMGSPRLRYQEGKLEGSGNLRVEIGECWERGGVVRLFVDNLKRKMGLLNSFKTRGQYSVEIRYDGSDHVESVEIRDD